jgi:hypothetical protein
LAAKKMLQKADRAVVSNFSKGIGHARSAQLVTVSGAIS